jgi:hypothetical protein
MVTVERSAIIRTPPDRVWAAYVDLSGWLAWNPHMRELGLLTEGSLAVGSRARLVLKTGLRSSWEVTELNPGRSFAWVANLVPGLRLAFDHIVEPAEGGSRAILRIDASGPVAVVAGPVLRLIYARNLDHSLAALKRLLEG